MAPVASTNDVDVQSFCDLVNEMTRSIASARQPIQSLLAKQDSELDTRAGISLLSLKNHVMLSYIQSLGLLSSHRVLGHSLLDRAPPSEPFGALDRPTRGSDAGDLVDTIVEDRIVLEKTKALEARMKYQIDKLVRLVQDNPQDEGDVIDDPLAFKPNLSSLAVPSTQRGRITTESANAEGGAALDVEAGSDDDGDGRDGIYRPPKLAPVPYIEGRPKKSKERTYKAQSLSSLLTLDPSRPHSESASGLGSGSASLSSARARELKHMTEFEEENMTRLVMNKKEGRRRIRDEEDMALGGAGARKGGGAALRDEFRDVLGAISRKRSAFGGDGYEELRQKGKKANAFERSRVRKVDQVDQAREGPRVRKKSRFESAIKANKQAAKRRN
ncbi:Sas10/Utp3/C1D family protein [Rhizoctonia solani 123E]|uniref:Sas10/Utp3/C1D family protein n=1 Tax=Rhizoctonia solani 123E TaxID=1423351 RepID=A0A074RRF2_9AGAM|nr:Sas10/Utp3/C1D family protein [Rhizoctonia solani 123E]